MAIDPSIIMSGKPADIYGSYQQGQLNAQKLQQNAANLQSTLNQNEQQTLNTQDMKRQNAFAEWDNTHELKQDPVTGEYDIQDYLNAADAAGHGHYARQAVQQLIQVKNQMQSSAGGQRDLIQKALIDAANSMQGMSPQQKAQVIDQTRQSILRNYKIDVNQMFGPNWADQMIGVQYTPQGYQTKETQYATPEGRDPSSQTSQTLRSLLNSRGANIPENVSAFEIYNNPTFKELIDAIPNATRVQAVGAIAGAEQQKQGVAGLINRIDDLSKSNLFKPGEALVNAISRLANTPEAARLQALVDDLNKFGIAVTPNMNLAGARESLQGKLGTIESGQAAQGAIAGNQTIPGAMGTAPLNAPQTATKGKSTEIAVYNKKTQQTIYVTPAQAAKIKAHANANTYEFR